MIEVAAYWLSIIVIWKIFVLFTKNNRDDMMSIPKDFENSNNNVKKSELQSQKSEKAVTPKKKQKFLKTNSVNAIKKLTKDPDNGLRAPGSNWEKFKDLVTATDAIEKRNNKGKKLNNIFAKPENGNQKQQNNVLKQYSHVVRGIQPNKLLQQTQPNKVQQHNPPKQITNNALNVNNAGPNGTGQVSRVQQNNSVEVIKSTSDENIPILTRIIAMDCEMVGINNGQDSMVARVSIVNSKGICIYDKYVKPTEMISDYRTEVSGIKPHHLQQGVNFLVVQKEVAQILKGRILVGHALHHDLKVLYLSHPRKFQRDTSRYKPFRKITNGNTPSLKRLAQELLGVSIQSGEHNPIEDARTALQIYLLFKKKWETEKRTHR